MKIAHIFCQPAEEAKRRTNNKAGIFLIVPATGVDEAKIIETAGLNAVIAQGYEAGGHLGIFNAEARDKQY